MVLSTGIEAVDRLLGGGLPEGSLVVLTAPPEAQVGPLLHAGLHERPTLYFTTIRDEAAVQTELDRLLAEPQIKSIQNVGLSNAINEVLTRMEDLQSGEDILISALDPIEASTPLSEYVSFLNYFIKRLQETGSIGIFHCLDTGRDSENRDFTLAAADFVWQLRCRRSGSKLVYTLEIPKASGLELSDEDRVMALELGQTVSIDTSRDIA